MGFYIDPRNETKEEWLAKRGEDIHGEPSFHRLDDLVTVCLVDNGGFTAAAIAVDQRERDRFAYPDGRRKRWFLVPISALVEDGFLLSADHVDPA